MEIRVGTSGYSFPDWRRAFYPAGLDKTKFLDFYVRYFPTVEINSTYYSIPHPKVMANMVEKVPPGFDFMVKVPQSITHRRTDLAGDSENFLGCIQPMAESGCLSGLLAQFPYSFKYSEDGLDYLSACRLAFRPHKLFVEFRHGSWVNRNTLNRLQETGIGYVSVDEPRLYGLLKPDLLVTGDVGYIRFHGRNAEHWWSGGARRYDYNYSQQELEEWLAKIEKVRNRIQRLYVYFNNCFKGQAAANALAFLDLVKSKREPGLQLN